MTRHWMEALCLFMATRANGNDELRAIPITDVFDVDGGGPAELLPGLGVEVNGTAGRSGDFMSRLDPGPLVGVHKSDTLREASRNMFSYHKEFWPMNGADMFTMVLSAVGLIVAAGGGIGGGGILVPLYMIAMKFRPKHAIALSNFTILGGSITNTLFNVRKTHEMGGSLIDWDVVVMMEPATIAGAVLGSFLSKYLSDFVLTVFLALVLAMLSYRTLDKGIKMFQRESDNQHKRLEGTHTPPDLAEDYRSDDDVSEAQQLIGRDHVDFLDQSSPWRKIRTLIACFLGCVVLTVLKGNGDGSILGVDCGSTSFWAISIAPVPWVMIFGAHFRRILISENDAKTQASVVRWDAKTTIKYPLVCTIAGVFAGLFGVGGGIVKGPLMLEMGIDPLVAAATAATMILFTTSAACVSFQVFGLLEPQYGAACFVLGLVCTAIGQGAVNAWMKAAKRQSPPVLSIGVVMALSTLLVALEAFERFAPEQWDTLVQPSGVCSSVD